MWRRSRNEWIWIGHQKEYKLCGKSRRAYCIQASIGCTTYDVGTAAFILRELCWRDCVTAEPKRQKNTQFHTRRPKHSRWIYVQFARVLQIDGSGRVCQAIDIEKKLYITLHIASYTATTEWAALWVNRANGACVCSRKREKEPTTYFVQCRCASAIHQPISGWREFVILLPPFCCRDGTEENDT